MEFLNNKHSRFSRIEGGLVPHERSNTSGETKTSGATKTRGNKMAPVYLNIAMNN